MRILASDLPPSIARYLRQPAEDHFPYPSKYFTVWCFVANEKWQRMGHDAGRVHPPGRTGGGAML
jgi:hypothetical protein